MDNFEKWDKLFRSQNLYEFSNNANGLIWLKVRAVCRSKQLSKFAKNNGIILKSKKISDKNRELFELMEDNHEAQFTLDKFLSDISNEWYTSLGIDRQKLEEDLYKIQHYAWGGDQNNSLDKFFVSRYVKVISSLEELERRKSEISINAWNYVQNSWYNNWTSYLIESFFKRDKNVVSAIGEIKSVDFFIGNYPLDLKVTFFPTQFLEIKLKDALGKSVLSWLKDKAKTYGFKTDSNLSIAQQIYTLTEKLDVNGHSEIVGELAELRRKIILDAQRDPIELLTWLYENQGEMRFGAENRLFLILSDSERQEDSWKLKRNYELIEPKIKSYLSSFSPSSLKCIDFTFKKISYKALADAIFVVK